MGKWHRAIKVHPPVPFIVCERGFPEKVDEDLLGDVGTPKYPKRFKFQINQVYLLRGGVCFAGSLVQSFQMGLKRVSPRGILSICCSHFSDAFSLASHTHRPPRHSPDAFFEAMRAIFARIVQPGGLSCSQNP